MSTFNETITLTNICDHINAKHGIVPHSEVRALTLDACVDTGAWNLVINEETRAALGLELEGSEFSTLADGTTVEYAMTGPVEIRWENRKFILSAQVIPTADEILLGAFALEALDVIADPVDECLKGRHGDKPLRRLKTMRRS
jgi:clan AA aspartic protease